MLEKDRDKYFERSWERAGLGFAEGGRGYINRQLKTDNGQLTMKLEVDSKKLETRS